MKERTDKPFGVNLRADQPDVVDRVDLLIQEGVRVASFAQAPQQDARSSGCKDGGVVVMPSIGAKRHAEKVAEWGVDAVHRAGRRGRRPHRLGADDAAAARRSSTPSTSR